MCGIVGYVGPEPACDILMDALRRLEYRGYDSAGVALVDGGLVVRKRAGKIAELATELQSGPPTGSTGIGHTRWATHGAPTTTNAHPHVDCTGSLAVVHNGIVENHAALRADLESAGHRFASDTDTEVLAHLVEAAIDAPSLADALRIALRDVEGSFAVAVVSASEPGRIVAARRGSPLVVGLTPDAGLLASDIPALLAHTRDVVIVEDDRVVDLAAGAVVITAMDGTEVEVEPRRVEWDMQSAERGGYAHFMLKEIHEQPQAVEDTLAGRIDDGGVVGVLDGIAGGLSTLDRVFVVGCGTSYHAGMVGRQAIERWARIPVEIDIASEFRYREPVIDDRTLVVGVSQSGETLDTLEGFRYARRLGGHTLAVCNVVDSSMAREADAALYTRAGPEIGVAATKTFVAQLAALSLLALALGQVRGKLDPDERIAVLRDLPRLPDLIGDVIASEDRVAAIAAEYDDVRDLFYLGRGTGLAVAMEGALKVKEIAYVRAEAYPAGELKHGPIALIEPGVLVVAVATQGPVRAKVLSNVQEVKARGAKVLIVANDGDEQAAALADHVVAVPPVHPLLAPALDVVPLQFVAYHMAVRRGRDVDQPRNLAKTVTVE